jgi:hypothetical protein
MTLFSKQNTTRFRKLSPPSYKNVLKIHAHFFRCRGRTCYFQKKNKWRLVSTWWRLPLHQRWVSPRHLRCPPPPPLKTGVGWNSPPLRWWKSTPAKGGEAPPPYTSGQAAQGEHIFMLKHLVVPLYFLESPEDPEDSPLHPFFSTCAVELLHVQLIHLFEGP